MARTNVTLPIEMIEEIDRLAGSRGRSAYVAEAVRARLKRDRMRQVFDETIGAAAQQSSWHHPDEVYRYVRSLRDDAPRDAKVKRAIP
jgi:metal-responsive CopG/Arc/MetJ family transcriptional regulator